VLCRRPAAGGGAPLTVVAPRCYCLLSRLPMLGALFSVLDAVSRRGSCLSQS
jgi:hypothetical protein